MTEPSAAGVSAALQRVRDRVAAAATAAGRDLDDIALLLAVKTVDVARISSAIAAGGTLLGHNRAQELLAVEPALSGSPALVHRSHFIGHLQSNKVNQVTRWVDCVQTVDSLALIAKLDKPRDDGPLEVMLQVNVSGEPSKYGVAPDAVGDLVEAAAAAEHLRLTGLMTIGANTDDAARVRAGFARLADLRTQILGSGVPGTEHADQLSMGMSGDLEIAVACGATVVRVGSAVFGQRR